MIVVKACEPWNDTGLDVVKGEVVRVSASGVWWDAHYEAGAGGYDAPALFSLVARWRRCPEAEWFELCGIVGRSPGDAFPIGERPEITMPASGRLYLFANDLKGLYWNNRGRLDVTVTKVTV